MRYLILIAVLVAGCKPSTVDKELEEIKSQMTQLSTRLTEIEINVMRMAALQAEADQKAKQERAKLDASDKPAEAK